MQARRYRPGDAGLTEHVSLAANASLAAQAGLRCQQGGDGAVISGRSGGR